MSLFDRVRLKIHHLLPVRIRYYLLEREMKKLELHGPALGAGIDYVTFDECEEVDSSASEGLN
jgi:hypothetical protein